jgi:hypothetical protein
MPQARILMILTSHRLDCLRLCLDMLIRGGSAARFDRICMLCSGVEGPHRAFVENLPRLHPSLKWDFFHGPRGRGKPISDLQNDCVRKYPDALYFKLDEDTLVSADWDLRMAEAYAAHRDDPRLALITAVVTNNQRGAYHLLTSFPELGEEFTRRFGASVVSDRMGPVWHRPDCASFVIRRFLNLAGANAELRARNPEPFQTFSFPFSINCIAYDYRHWQEIGGVPEQDENGWGEWIPRHDKFIVLATQSLVHHYAFFVQQDWLDRSSLLEDIRQANLPDTMTWVDYGWARAVRVARQVPSIIRRRLGRT